MCVFGLCLVVLERNSRKPGIKRTEFSVLDKEVSYSRKFNKFRNFVLEVKRSGINGTCIVLLSWEFSRELVNYVFRFLRVSESQ